MYLFQQRKQDEPKIYQGFMSWLAINHKMIAEWYFCQNHLKCHLNFDSLGQIWSPSLHSVYILFEECFILLYLLSILAVKRCSRNKYSLAEAFVPCQTNLYVILYLYSSIPFHISITICKCDRSKQYLLKWKVSKLSIYIYKVTTLLKYYIPHYTLSLYETVPT